MSWFWIGIIVMLSYCVYWVTQFMREEFHASADEPAFGPSTPKENPPVTTIRGENNES